MHQSYSFDHPLADKLRREAGSAGLNHSAIGSRIGMSHTTVGEWLNGKRRPSRQQCFLLEDILVVQKGELAILAGYTPADDHRMERDDDGTLTLVYDAAALDERLAPVALLARAQLNQPVPMALQPVDLAA